MTRVSASSSDNGKGHGVASALGGHRPFVRARLRRLGVPPERLDDAVQDVFVVVVKRLEDFDEQRAMRPWLAGIARRIAGRERDRHRTQARRDGGSLSETTVGSEDRRLEAARLIEQYMQHVDGQLLEVFLLVEVRGMTAREVGDHLGINPNTVSTRLRSARRELDRVVARHELAERRWLAGLVPMGWLGGRRNGRPFAGGVGPRAWIIGLLGVATVAVGTALVSLDTCGASYSSAPESDAETSRSGSQQGVGPGAAALGERAADRPTRAPGLESFSWSGTGMSMYDGASVSTRTGYRIRGTTIDLRLEMENTSTVAYLGHEVWTTSDALALELEATVVSVDLEPGEVRVLDFSYTLPEGDVFDLALEQGDRNGGRAGTQLCFCRERGGIEMCPDTACVGEAPAVQGAQRGESITFWIRSTCDAPLTLAITPPSAELIDSSYRQMTLDAGASTKITVDIGLVVRKLDTESGRFLLSASVDAPDQEIWFGCSTVSTGTPAQLEHHP